MKKKSRSPHTTPGRRRAGQNKQSAKKFNPALKRNQPKKTIHAGKHGKNPAAAKSVKITVSKKVKIKNYPLGIANRFITQKHLEKPSGKRGGKGKRAGRLSRAAERDLHRRQKGRIKGKRWIWKKPIEEKSVKWTEELPKSKYISQKIQTNNGDIFYLRFSSKGQWQKIMNRLHKFYTFKSYKIMSMNRKTRKAFKFTTPEYQKFLASEKKKGHYGKAYVAKLEAEYKAGKHRIQYGPKK